MNSNNSIFSKIKLFLIIKRRNLRRNRITTLLKKRSENGFFAIDFNTAYTGLGGRIVGVLEILLFCETNGYIPLIKFNYQEKENIDYFKELFYYKNLPLPLPLDIKYTTIVDSGDFQWDYNQKLTLKTAKNLFDKYLGFNPAVLNEVNSFTDKWFAGKRVLGIHYRGTDKMVEAPSVSLDKLLHHIRQLMNDQVFNLIFLSTDEVKVLEYLKNSDLPIPVIFRDDAIRSKDGNQVHLRKENSKVLINNDAIVNCLILSRCDFLLKTASILSDCSIIFNPGLQALVINSPYDHLTWWPATEINQYALYK